MLVRAMITDPAEIRIRALIPDHHAALRTGRAMSMPRLERRCLPATGLPSASGTGRAGGSTACESAAAIKLGLPALLFDVFPRLIVGLADKVFATRASAANKTAQPEVIRWRPASDCSRRATRPGLGADDMLKSLGDGWQTLDPAPDAAAPPYNPGRSDPLIPARRASRDRGRSS